MTPLSLQTKTIVGAAEGPHLLITGGVHGDEFESMVAIRRLARLLESAPLRGQITLVPVVNESAYRRRHRCGDDGLDLARTCPGRPDGTITERTADALSRLIRGADYYIDLHTGGTMLSVFPLVGYMLHPDTGVLETQRRLAHAFNLPVVWGTTSRLDGRSLSVARDARIPALYAEYHGAATCDPAGVGAYVEGCLNVMAVLGMVEREPKPDVMTPQELIEIGRKAGVPVLVDSAGELPPTDRLTRYSDMGADLVVISGGKGLHGPSSTGILAGRKPLIEGAIMNASPNANIGRGQKVNREEIVGLVVALDQYLKADHGAELRAWTRKARYLSDQLQSIPGLTAELRMNSRGYADVVLSWDKNVIPLSEPEVGRKLLEGEPRIAYMTNKIIYAFTNPTLVPSSLKDGEEVIMAKRLRQFFSEDARRPASQGEAATAAAVSDTEWL